MADTALQAPQFNLCISEPFKGCHTAIEISPRKSEREVDRET